MQRRIVIATHVAELGFSLNFRGGRGCCRSTGDWLKGPATPRGRINIAAEAFTATTRQHQAKHVRVGSPRHHLIHQDNQQRKDPEDPQGRKGELITIISLANTPNSFYQSSIIMYRLCCNFGG